MKSTFYSVLVLFLLSCKRETPIIEKSTETVSEIEVLDGSTTRYDSIEKFNTEYLNLVKNPTKEELDLLRTNLKSYLENPTEFFTYVPEDGFQPQLASSKDDFLKIYSYDNMMGGTMRFYDKIWIWNNTSELNKTQVNLDFDDTDAKGMVYKIDQIKNSEQVYYLVFGQSKLSNRDIINYVEAYEIKDLKLNKVSLFHTGSKKLSRISVEYDFFSVVDRPERPVELITLTNNKLKVALVNKDLSVTTKNLTYEWDGSAFNYKGVE